MPLYRCFGTNNTSMSKNRIENSLLPLTMLALFTLQVISPSQKFPSLFSEWTVQKMKMTLRVQHCQRPTEPVVNLAQALATLPEALHISTSSMSLATGISEGKAETIRFFSYCRYYIAEHIDAHRMALFLLTLWPIAVYLSSLPSIGSIL